MNINYNDSKGNDRIADLNEIISIIPSYTDKYAFEQVFRFDLRGYFFALIVSASFVMVRRGECI
jgi:hypothetical protein